MTKKKSMKYKGFSIVSVPVRESMYEKGYKYRATGYGSKMYGRTLKEIKELINKTVKQKKEFPTSAYREAYEEAFGKTTRKKPSDGVKKVEPKLKKTNRCY